MFQHNSQRRTFYPLDVPLVPLHSPQPYLFDRPMVKPRQTQPFNKCTPIRPYVMQVNKQQTKKHPTTSALTTLRLAATAFPMLDRSIPGQLLCAVTFRYAPRRLLPRVAARRTPTGSPPPSPFWRRCHQVQVEPPASRHDSPSQGLPPSL